jgi:hypothetical protein
MDRRRQSERQASPEIDTLPLAQGGVSPLAPWHHSPSSNTSTI